MGRVRMDRVKILIADNSPVYKKMFASAAMEADTNASVASAADGEKALELIRRENYDIVIIDADIPGMGLLNLLSRIALEIPKAYILVTARPSKSADALFSKALSKGAAECMTKPIYDSYIDNLSTIRRKLTEIIEVLRCDGRTSGYGSREKIDSEADNSPAAVKPRKESALPDIMLIAASTGGPVALDTVLSQLSDDFPVPILVVQHIPSHFTENLAQSLNSKSQLMVKVAESGETVLAGTVYLAPGGTHMKLDSRNRIYLDNSPPIHGVRPAADELFGSVAEAFTGAGVLAVILSGMGNDGRDGLARLKAGKECFCLVQSERTCVVYGMPRAAAEAGFADKIVDLEKMAVEIKNLYKQGRNTI